ncbi:transposase [Streptomyces cyslabdanicus]|uniref:transposase n=1 Tax=Streptomyces cyslabdanicus TaxID=1470456 RepID=UPI0040447947
MPDDLWGRIEPLLPVRQRRPRHPGRLPLDDRGCLRGFLFVLHTGIQWEWLPQELGFGSGMTCWRRLRDWHEAGVRDRLHQVLLAELHRAAGVPHGSGLGSVRWVVERTNAWIHGFRRLRIRWEIRDDIHEAFLKLACCVITYRRVQALC